MSEPVLRGYKVLLTPVRKDGPTLLITCVDGRPPDVKYAGSGIATVGESKLRAYMIEQIARIASDLSKQFPDYDPD